MNYRREVDGLRAIAVLPVLFFHAGFETFKGGFVGVDIFFVISGYLITTILINELEAGTFSLLTFYERRARRILPALFFVMFVCLPLAWFLLLYPKDMRDFAQSVASVPLFISNLLFWRTSGYFETAAELKPLLHTWSLAVEEQFYIFFPLLLLWFWKFGVQRILLFLSLCFILSLGLAQVLVASKPISAFFLLPTRGFELLTGAFVAFYFFEKKETIPLVLQESLSLLGLGFILYSLFYFDKNTPTPSLHTLIPVLGTALILIFANEHTKIGRFLGSSLFVGIGLVSYSAYLWHQPLLAFARHYYVSELNGIQASTMLLLTLVLAFMSWKYVETPFRDKKKISRQSVFKFSLVGSLFFIALGLVGHFTNGFEQRTTAQAFRGFDYNLKQLGFLPCKDTHNFDSCFLTRDAPLQALIMGDSHAEDKFYGLAKNSALNWGLISNASCPPVLGIQVEGEQKGCLEKYTQLLPKIVQNTEVKLVFLSFFGQYPLTTAYSADHKINRFGPNHIQISSNETTLKDRQELFYYGLANMIKTLLKAQKKIVVALDIPELPFFPVECLKAKRACEITIAETHARQAAHRAMLIKLKQEFPEIKIFDPTSLFCKNETCHFKNETVTLYRDSHHLTLQGSDAYGKLFNAW